MTRQGALSSFNRPGWLTFAAVVMFSVGVMQAISGIYFLSNSTRIADVYGGAFGHHTAALVGLTTAPSHGSWVDRSPPSKRRALGDK
jgi:hypothetical protein